MEINKVDMFRLSNFVDSERVYISIVNDGSKIMVEPLSSDGNPDLLEDEVLSGLSVGEMMRTFKDDEEMPDNFGILVRVR